MLGKLCEFKDGKDCHDPTSTTSGEEDKACKYIGLIHYLWYCSY